MSNDHFRAYFKKSGTNPEVAGAFYELASYESFVGIWNCLVLTPDFRMGVYYSKLRFRPIDAQKPIVFAIEGSDGHCNFVVVDTHVTEVISDNGMRNYRSFQTDGYLVDGRDSVTSTAQKSRYWSITSEGMTFVYGDQIIPGTWRLLDCDLLCAFIGGELTAQQLRYEAYYSDVEESKEERREEHIQTLSLQLQASRSVSYRLQREISDLVNVGVVALEGYDRTVTALNTAAGGFWWWPFVLKSKVRKILEEDNDIL